MKKALTYLILFVTISASMSRALVIGAFFVNQNRIAKTLCENRAKPSKHCDGKCYLKKQMAKDAKKEKQSSLPFSVNEILQEFIVMKYPQFEFPVFGKTAITSHFSAYSFSYSHIYFSEIPHPPSV